MKARIAAACCCAFDDDEGPELDDEEPEVADRSGELLGVADGPESSWAPTSAAPRITASTSNMAAAAIQGNDERPALGRASVAVCPTTSRGTATGGTATGSDGVACMIRVPSVSVAARGVG